MYEDKKKKVVGLPADEDTRTEKTETDKESVSEIRKVNVMSKDRTKLIFFCKIIVYTQASKGGLVVYKLPQDLSKILRYYMFSYKLLFNVEKIHIIYLISLGIYLYFY